MVRLEDLTKGSNVLGILPSAQVTIVSTEWMGDDALVIVYRQASGEVDQEILYRDREADLDLVEADQPWSFTGDGEKLRLVSEAHRIRLAHLFDPLLAVHTSMVEPLPHQITAVYGEMIPRQPLRFLLADDPGAGKTIMAGLLMRELLIRGDLHRCLIICPGSLATQWQDELYQKFHLPFDILTRDRIEAARTGNALGEIPFLIARLDQLSRNDDLLAKLQQTDWDLVVCDEAHKMSASFFGKEIKETKRYKLGKLLGTITRHLLLMTATPHNGKEEDFQLFMALLDSDRFEGRFRNGVHASDTSDLMRRMVKEDLLKFDGKPLFPERIATTVGYKLSDLEDHLYQKVTDYVREEFNRAESLGNDGRKGTVGFALTILQRRLASSPEAIYQSLKRRRERLQKRVQEEEQRKRHLNDLLDFGPTVNVEDIEDDFDDYEEEEREAAEQEVVDQATAAQTIAELKIEIAQLEDLESLALRVRRGGNDRKWEQLSRVIQSIFSPQRHEEHEEDPLCSLCLRGSRKLVIFTEHRDTLNYLVDRIQVLLGKPEAVVTIHGGMRREERKKAETAFKQDVHVQVLIATDAAGEGINLQRAHLMVNYDLPWNPNRLEQRFGRIHRIGQTEVCHLWNLVAAETREGDVYFSLLKKLEIEQKALGGQVFDVLGRAIAGKELRELLIEAIRYGDRPDVKAKLNQVVENRLDQNRLRELLEERALARDSMDASKVQRIREEMDRAEARRLQPHFIAAFFLEAFQQLGGRVNQREPKRYQVSYVPSVIRSRNRVVGLGEPILRSYERICFEKDLINMPGKPVATFVCPGHSLLDAVIDLTLEKHRDLLKQGAVLVDVNDPNEQPRVLVYLEHSIQDARTDSSGRRRVVSRRMQYVEIDPEGHILNAGYAPYLNYRPLLESEQPVVESLLRADWLKQDIEAKAKTYAVKELVPQHVRERQEQQGDLIDKTMAAVQERLTKEILYWDQQAEKLRQQEAEGKPNAKLNSDRATARADELQSRLERRMDELAKEKRLSPVPPLVVGGALIVPMGLLQRLQGKRDEAANLFAKETKRVEQAAMDAVMAAERQLGSEPRDVSKDKLGYDIESRIPGSGRLRFIEVKGRIAGAETVTVTKNEIITALNQPEAFILAMVQVPRSEEFAAGDAFQVKSTAGSYNAGDGSTCAVRYVRQPFQKEPDFGVTSVNYGWKELWERGTDPS